MKKLLLTSVLSTALLLAACGEESEPETIKAEDNTEVVEEVEATETEKLETVEEETETVEQDSSSDEIKSFENNAFEIQMARVEITGSEILPPDEYDDSGKERLIVRYEVTSKVSPEESEEVDVSAWSVWMETMSATQENETSIANLEHGFTPEEYFDYQDTEMNVIKKDATIENIAIYNLDNRDYPVVLKATQGIAGDDLGSIEIDVSK